MKKFLLQIDGMMCGHCESHVNDVVRRAATVKSVNSSHTGGTCEIVLDDNTSLAPIIAAIEADGYKVLSSAELPYDKPSLFKKLFKK